MRALAIVLVLIASTSSAQTPQEQPLPTAADIEYLGSFLVPTSDGAGPASATWYQLNYGGYGLGLGPDGASLYYGCHDWHSRLGRITNPTPSLVAPFPMAKIVEPCTTVPNLNAIDPDASGTRRIGGTLRWNGRLILSAFHTYDGNGNATGSHFSGDSIAGLRGPVRVSGSGILPGKIGGGHTVVPQEWRPILGGPVLAGQCCISIITRSSFGPSVSVFDPDNIGAASITPATLLVHYTTADGFKPVLWSALRYGGLAWPSGYRGVIALTLSGTSANSCYGTGTSDQSLHMQPTPDGKDRYCYDPTSGAKGYHAYPSKIVGYVYDAVQFAEVVKGTRSPLNLQPVSEIDLPPQIGSTELTSAVYDDTTRRLYVVGARTPPRVHVMRVKPAPPSGPTVLTCTVQAGDSVICSRSGPAPAVGATFTVTLPRP